MECLEPLALSPSLNLTLPRWRGFRNQSGEDNEQTLREMENVPVSGADRGNGADTCIFPHGRWYKNSWLVKLITEIRDVIQPADVARGVCGQNAG